MFPLNSAIDPMSAGYINHFEGYFHQDNSCLTCKAIYRQLPRIVEEMFSERITSTQYSLKALMGRVQHCIDLSPNEYLVAFVFLEKVLAKESGTLDDSHLLAAIRLSEKMYNSREVSFDTYVNVFHPSESKERSDVEAEDIKSIQSILQSVGANIDVVAQQMRTLFDPLVSNSGDNEERYNFEVGIVVSYIFGEAHSSISTVKSNLEPCIQKVEMHHWLAGQKLRAAYNTLEIVLSNLLAEDVSRGYVIDILEQLEGVQEATSFVRGCSFPLENKLIASQMFIWEQLDHRLMVSQEELQEQAGRVFALDDGLNKCLADYSTASSEIPDISQRVAELFGGYFNDELQIDAPEFRGFESRNFKSSKLQPVTILRVLEEVLSDIEGKNKYVEDFFKKLLVKKEWRARYNPSTMLMMSLITVFQENVNTTFPECLEILCNVFPRHTAEEMQDILLYLIGKNTDYTTLNTDDAVLKLQDLKPLDYWMLLTPLFKGDEHLYEKILIKFTEQLLGYKNWTMPSSAILDWVKDIQKVGRGTVGDYIEIFKEIFPDEIVKMYLSAFEEKIGALFIVFDGKPSLKDWVLELQVKTDYQLTDFLVAGVYLERIRKLTPGKATPLQILLVALDNAAKYYGEKPLNAVDYEKFANFSANQLRQIERRFGHVLGYDFAITREELDNIASRIFNP
ncbi:MAG: hypothetical protein ACQEP8_01935 [Chlamydiota bacterium]